MANVGIQTFFTINLRLSWHIACQTCKAFELPTLPERDVGEKWPLSVHEDLKLSTGSVSLLGNCLMRK